MAADSSERLYVQNFDGWKAALSKKRFSDKELEVKVIERGIVLPALIMDGAWKGGVCDNDFNFVAGYSRVKNNGGGLLLFFLHTLLKEKNLFSSTRM